MSSLKNLTILYVEDEEDTREHLYFYLENSFKKVFMAKNGLEGLDIYNNNKIDIIVSDIRMPIMNGLKMMEKIKKDNPNIPFLLTTAYSDQKYLLKSIELGVSGYILKPIDIEKLFEKLEFASKYIQEQKTIEMLVQKMSKQDNSSVNEFIKAFDSALLNFSTQEQYKLYDGFIYDFKTKSMKHDNKEIKLNNQEILVLEYLLKNKGKVATYEEIEYIISRENPSIETLRTIIKSIRKKTYKEIILNLSGVGYKIV